MPATSTAKLVTHAGAYAATLEQVCAIKAPARTASWNPISHGVFVNTVTKQLTALGIVATNPQFALAKDGGQFFGCYDLTGIESREWTMALGIRNSIDKTLPAGLVAGSRVFICDNMAFSGEVSLARKHTTHINSVLARMIRDALVQVMNLAKSQEITFERLKATEVPQHKAHDTLVRMAIAGTIPARSIVPIAQEYEAPRFADFRARSAWSLLNACTTHVRHDTDIAPDAKESRLLGIHRDICAEYVASVN